MDLKALQLTLRQFAHARDWKPFHTPKNLAMALVVEAAELAEIFQWLTPEQSEAAHNDVVLRERIADEVADVLLYLVQIADHTAVDLKRAVDRKLVKNAKKHPPLRPGLPAGTAASSDVETHVLVDWENVQPRDTDIRTLVPDVTDVWLFHGPNQRKVSDHQASFGDRVTPVQIARTGKNALDFHLSFYMGYIASRHPDARFVVVSNDKGYAPMLEHATHLGFSARQVGFGGAVATATRTRTRTPAAKKAAPAKNVATRTAVARGGAARAVAVKEVAAKEVAAKKVAAKKVAVKKPAVTKPADQGAAPAARRATAARTKPTLPATKPLAVRGARADATRAQGTVDLKQATAHVLSGLKKTANKPTRQARLLAVIKSLVGPSADDQVVQAVLSRLLAGGEVAIDSKGAVRYGFL